jgi:glycosyltransferase involved in cell wall biosynthesis
MRGLTVLIPCFNNEAIIGDCLRSVAPIADEIFVVDSGSTDRTRAIAADYTDRILVHEYENSAAQKNWAIPQAAHEWVLVVDTDERATPELRNEVQQLLASTPPCDGYRVRFLNHLFGRPIRHGDWSRASSVRLFRRDLSRYEDRHVHADVRVESGRVGDLRGRLLHYSYESFEQYMDKCNRYTTWGAMDLQRAGVRATPWKLVMHPVWRSFRSLILRGGILDGTPGLVVGGLAGVTAFMKYAKLWGMEVRAGTGEAKARDDG